MITALTVRVQGFRGYGDGDAPRGGSQKFGSHHGAGNDRLFSSGQQVCRFLIDHSLYLIKPCSQRGGGFSRGGSRGGRGGSRGGRGGARGGRGGKSQRPGKVRRMQQKGGKSR